MPLNAGGEVPRNPFLIPNGITRLNRPPQLSAAAAKFQRPETRRRPSCLRTFRLRFSGTFTLFTPAPRPIGYNREQMFSLEKNRERRVLALLGCPSRFCPENPLALFFVVSMHFLFLCAKCRHGLADWRRWNAGEARPGPNSRECLAVFGVADGRSGAAGGVRA